MTISHRQFVRGQGEAKVNLRKGGDRRAKDASKIISNLIRDTNWEKVVLWQLMERQVACSKSSRICSACMIASLEQRKKIKVSSAYWRTGQGESTTTGCLREVAREGC